MALDSSPVTERPPGALYRVVWRWHFYVGLLCAPLLLLLAATGAIYLWKPQYENYRYRGYLEVPARGALVSLDAQLAAARDSLPAGWRAELFTPSPAPGRAAQVQVRDDAGRPHTVFVDPHRGQAIGRRADDATLMAKVKALHGSLLLGRGGELLVELAASWCFVLLVTGLYLWWPRPFTARGFFLPRFGAGRRALLRDLHAVPAVWAGIGILFLLATGLPWTRTGGEWFRTLAQATGQWQPRETSASAHRSELLGGWSPYLKDRHTAERLETVASAMPVSFSPPAVSAAHTPSHGSAPAPRGRAAPSIPEDAPLTEKSLPPSLSLTRVAEIAAERGVSDAYSIALPQEPAGVYSVLSDRTRAFSRTYLHLDRFSGQVLADVRYRDFGWAAKAFSVGIIAHEGQLFGLTNQLLGLGACLALIGTTVTGGLLWWQRRPGRIPAPAPRRSFPALPRPALLLTLGLALFLPLLALSLIACWIFDRLLGHRLAARVE